jgi:hypothetical protein
LRVSGLFSRVESLSVCTLASLQELCGGYVPMDHPDFTAECAAAMARHTMEKRKRHRPSQLTRAVSVTFARRDDDDDDVFDFAPPHRPHSSMALQFKFGSPPPCDGRSGGRPSNRTLDFLVPPNPCVSPDNELVLGCDASPDSLASPPPIPLASAFDPPSSPSIPFHRAYSATATYGSTGPSLLGGDSVVLRPLGVDPSSLLPRPAPAPAPAPVSVGPATVPATTMQPPQLPQNPGVRRGPLFGRE